MSEKKKCLSRHQKRLLTMLGDTWSAVNNGCGMCICKHIGSRRIEITGGRRWGESVSVLVWNKAPYWDVEERHHGIRPCHDDLKAVCDGIEERCRKKAGSVI